jgi:hypothetical protein
MKGEEGARHFKIKRRGIEDMQQQRKIKINNDKT